MCMSTSSDCRYKYGIPANWLYPLHSGSANLKFVLPISTPHLTPPPLIPLFWGVPILYLGLVSKSTSVNDTIHCIPKVHCERSTLCRSTVRSHPYLLSHLAQYDRWPFGHTHLNLLWLLLATWSAGVGLLRCHSLASTESAATVWQSQQRPALPLLSQRGQTMRPPYCVKLLGPACGSMIGQCGFCVSAAQGSGFMHLRIYFVGKPR